ncbi:MAG: nickel ABC transporter permease subunit NikB, partial [Desulfovibrionaceae bacterium]|nr:nickel ABC transporter permease subunit NikB [Desulfovibrionaceae bacterium]
MFVYIIRRLLLLIPMLLGVSVVVFCILHWGEGDPAMAYLRLSRIPPSVEALEEARRHLGLDQPLAAQYLEWLWKAVRLDFGVSYVTRRPVLDDLLYYLPATLELAGAALILTLAVSLPLGILAALRRDRWQDHLARGFAFFGVSMPNFWLAFLMVYVFSVKLDWLPALGRGGPQHLIMPAMALALMSTAINTRLVRLSMLEHLGQRFVLYARVRGVSERRIVLHDVLKNAALPVITALGMHVGELLGGAVVIESVFAWPGVGRYAVSAIYNRDFPV